MSEAQNVAGRRPRARCAGLSHDDEVEIAARGFALRATAWQFVESVAAGDVASALAHREDYYRHFDCILRATGMDIDP